MKKLKNLFSYETYCIFNLKNSISICLIPNIEISRDNYNSFYIYELFISWLCFGIKFKYTWYKNN